MADTIGGGINEDGSVQNTLVIDEKYADNIDIVGLDNAGVTELAVNKPIKNFDVGLKGDKDVAIAGARIVNTTIVNEAPAGETASLTVEVAKAKKFEFEATGEGATDLTFAAGKLPKPQISTSNADDSINFASSSITKSATVDTGDGDDTVVFNGRMKGKQNIVFSGDGEDTIEINRKGRGKLRLADFSDDDTLTITDKNDKTTTITTDNLDDAPKWLKFGGDPR